MGKTDTPVYKEKAARHADTWRALLRAEGSVHRLRFSERPTGRPEALAKEEEMYFCCPNGTVIDEQGR